MLWVVCVISVRVFGANISLFVYYLKIKSMDEISQEVHQDHFIWNER